MTYDSCVLNCVSEVGQTAWDELSAGRPFTSYRWYAFGERVLNDCKPVYIILSKGGRQISRGTFWLIRNEQVPISSRPVRHLIELFLQRRPLLACRSPLSSSGGLILPEAPLGETALQTIASIAFEKLKLHHGSFLLLDYIDDREKAYFTGWTSGMSTMTMNDPGTRLELKWNDFDDFLLNNKHRMHQHYRRTSRQAEDIGIQITRRKNVSDIGKALELIQNVEKRHKSITNPLARLMLENINMTDSTWLEAHIGSKLVGCLLLLEDNGAQYAFLPGLAYDNSITYFMLLYEAIKNAFDKGITTLRWGNFAYEIKRRLGFELEHNNNVIYQSNSLIAGLIVRMAASYL
jgi:predicted N-acyltransferase